MPDGEVKIRITGDASGAVAASQQAGAALEKMAEPRMKLLDLSQQEKEAIAAHSGAANADSGELEENSKKSGFLGQKKGELKKEVRELGREFPIAGMAAKAMLNPLVFGITSAVW